MKAIPKGLKSMVIRALVKKTVELAEAKGSEEYVGYGMIIDGSFDIVHCKKQK